MCESNCGCGNCNNTGIPVIPGTQGNPGQDGLPGAQGSQGYSITNATVVGDDLILTITDPATGNVFTVNAGNVRGPVGADGVGADGPPGPMGPPGSPAGLKQQVIPLFSAGITSLTGSTFVSPAPLFATNNVNTFLTTAASTSLYFGYPLFIYPGTLYHLKPNKIKLLCQAENAAYIGKIELVAYQSGFGEVPWLVGGNPSGSQSDSGVLVGPATTEPVIIDLSDYIADGRFSTYWGSVNPDNITSGSYPATNDTLICIKVTCDTPYLATRMSWISLIIEY